MGRLDADLNPDVPTKDLHVLDQQALAKFNGEIYKLIRAGQRKEAIDRCLQSGQSWKAAMMEGTGSENIFAKQACIPKNVIFHPRRGESVSLSIYS